MSSSEIHPCVVIATRNHSSSLHEVLADVSPYIEEIIVVDDGSQDGTGEVPAEFPQVEVVSHEKKRGKGRSLVHGFHRARELGYTHAVTVGDHGRDQGRDLPVFLEKIRSEPEALITGVRSLQGKVTSFWGRLRRGHANLWMWVLTRARPGDALSSYRAYPLEKICRVNGRKRKGDYEMELLVKHIWLGGKVDTVPLSAESGTSRRCKFASPLDPVRRAFLQTILLAQCLFLPEPLRQILHGKDPDEIERNTGLWTAIRQTFQFEFSNPRRFALSAGTGVFLAFTPFWGLQTVLAYFAAHRLKLSRIVCVAASGISFPAIMPFVIYLCLITGQLVLTGTANYSLAYGSIDSEMLWNLAFEYLVGSAILCTAAGLVTGFVSYFLIKWSYRPAEEPTSSI